MRTKYAVELWVNNSVKEYAPLRILFHSMGIHSVSQRERAILSGVKAQIQLSLQHAYAH